MEEYSKKICTRCGVLKSTSRSFDISPKTGRAYPRCKDCRKVKSTYKACSIKKGDETKRHCVECGLRFIPLTIYEKTCCSQCDELWRSHRGILKEAGTVRMQVKGQTILLDTDDFSWAKFYTWNFSRQNTSNGPMIYAYRRCVFQNHIIHIKMEREVMEVEDGLVCDHINHNGLDNRKVNLRICSQQQNTWNKRKSKNKLSKYKGVSWHKESSKWRAYIAHDGKYHHLGFFDKEEDAALAYDESAKKHYGEFACLNFPNALVLSGDCKC